MIVLPFILMLFIGKRSLLYFSVNHLAALPPQPQAYFPPYRNSWPRACPCQTMLRPRGKSPSFNSPDRNQNRYFHPGYLLSTKPPKERNLFRKVSLGYFAVKNMHTCLFPSYFTTFFPSSQALLSRGSQDLPTHKTQVSDTSICYKNISSPNVRIPTAGSRTGAYSILSFLPSIKSSHQRISLNPSRYRKPTVPDIRGLISKI